MAKYSITHLNYMATGKNRTFLNFDMQLQTDISAIVDRISSELSTYGNDVYKTRYIKANENTPLSREETIQQIILNEQQGQKRYSVESLSSLSNSKLQKILEFSNSQKLVNQTYILDSINAGNDKNNITCDNLTIKNMYDIVDVSIKKEGSHSIVDANLFNTDARHDIYAPITQQPVGFCQSQMMNQYVNDALILSQPTTIAGYDLKTNLSSLDQSTSDMHYQTSIEQNRFKTYFYKMSSDNPVTTQDFFTPSRQFSGVRHQVVVDMPVDSTNSNQNANDIAQYDDGTAYYARMHSTKNAFDSSYSMNVPNEQQLSACRTYYEINSCGGKPYFKYVDDSTYNALSTSIENSITQYSTTKSETEDLIPFQKIEFLYPVDYSYSSMHKSNAFNVQILNTGIQTAEDNIDESDADYEDIKNKLFILKNDIQHAVREIVENIAPANTQLFNVEFGD